MVVVWVPEPLIRVADAEEELKRNTADWTKEKAEETRWNVKSLKKGIDKLTAEIDGVELDTLLSKEEQSTTKSKKAL